MNIAILGSGSFIPENILRNEDFANTQFLNEDGTPLPATPEVVVRKFKEITGIEERRYADKDVTASQMGTIAAQRALAKSGIDPETLDYIILAHNFGDVRYGAIQSDILPSLASRVKQELQIKNPKCVAYDILFGCPGWLEGVIQAYAFIKAGLAKRCLVIGTETLSRVVDPFDRDSMIYSDGAGATVIGAHEGDSAILGMASATYALEEAGYLFFGPSNEKQAHRDIRYIKMYGRKIYEFALSKVPQAMKDCIDASPYKVTDIKKILIHQANEKMDEAIIQRFYKLHGQTPPPNIMPMSIHKLGNSSVATIPTLFDLLVQEKIENHELVPGDIIMFASVGAGMNVNCMLYRY
ncbi:3-oxoacyl-ACP synthase III family protein [Flavobacterium aurantiibacter]|uniref:3-oxoacyl-ACP synthase n=1 Tax=Flavobacterium aurantiibacter TaxID=2023067 RepID=A0A255ZSA0_9FLAO|nr:ketoacyl-ACP synthase III [Flavobacterium aurantiibacter]OYQ44383.1 3-oxoacyl-ACP synthase [Flavobacterium aurantiibacter]